MTVVHRRQCAAITNGCPSVLLWEALPGDDGTDPTSRGGRLLALNGWWQDRAGEWLCGLHDEYRGQDYFARHLAAALIDEQARIDLAYIEHGLTPPSHPDRRGEYVPPRDAVDGPGW